MEPCPRVGALQFLKGDPVDVQSEIDKGKTVVIELFATWCGPCHQSIPHVTELQKQFPDVIIIGVSTSDTPEKLRPFLQQKGDQIGYRIAIDSLGAVSPLQTKFNVRGIPHAFVISEGKVCYSGHPMQPGFESSIKSAVQKYQQSLSTEDLLALPVSTLKKMLRDQGKSAAGCIEKSDLVNKLKAKY